jgi:pimeloyl-ACP methyl ester carboxylesterase
VSPTLKRTLLWLLGVALVAGAIGAGVFVWWGLHPLGPEPGALAALQTDSHVRVTQAADGWEFAPASGEPSAALVFYPGGHVDARSYAQYARDVAERGYLVIVPVMPLSLAVLSPNAAGGAIMAHPGMSRWVIGGHSLGGAMAASFAAKHPGAIQGLVLLAAYPPSGADLSSDNIQALTEVGTLDTVVNRANLAAGAKLLPRSAVTWDLDGGNHAQFGDYGPQPGDNPNPTMPAADQRRRAVDGTDAVLGGRAPVETPPVQY